MGQARPSCPMLVSSLGTHCHSLLHQPHVSVPFPGPSLILVTPNLATQVCVCTPCSRLPGEHLPALGHYWGLFGTLPVAHGEAGSPSRVHRSCVPTAHLPLTRPPLLKPASLLLMSASPTTATGLTPTWNQSKKHPMQCFHKSNFKESGNQIGFYR